MKSYKHIASRDKFSGHWWFKHLGLTIEMYRAGKFEWDLHGIYLEHRNMLISQILYAKLGDKINVAYPVYCQRVIPRFCTIRAALNWMSAVHDHDEMETL